MRHRSLMTAYTEGSIISRELREMLNNETADVRFERQLAVLDAQCGIVWPMDPDRFCDMAQGDLKKAGAL